MWILWRNSSGGSNDRICGIPGPINPQRWDILEVDLSTGHCEQNQSGLAIGDFNLRGIGETSSSCVETCQKREIIHRQRLFSTEIGELSTTRVADLELRGRVLMRGTRFRGHTSNEVLLTESAAYTVRSFVVCHSSAEVSYALSSLPVAHLAQESVASFRAKVDTRRNLRSIGTQRRARF